MKIFGLVVAIETEINALLESGCEFKKVDDKTYEVYETTINENKLYVIHSGCGEVFAGIATQYLITKYNVEFIFNYGICGALKPNLETSTCSLVKEVINYDFDTDPIDKKGIGFHTEINELYLKPDQDLISKALEIIDLPLYRCASGDKFIDLENDRKYLNEKFEADICEMEAAGILLTCYQNKIPALLLKGISDSYQGGGQEFSKMAKTSSLIAAKIFIQIIKNI